MTINYEKLLSDRWRPLHDPSDHQPGGEPTRLNYEDLRRQGLNPRSDAEADEMERELAELLGDEPAVTGRVELRQIRRKWHLIVRFKVARGTRADDSEFATMLEALRSRPLWDAAVTIRSGCLRVEVPKLGPALEALERMLHDPDLRDSDEVTIEARRPVLAPLAHAWADTRRVRATLLGAGRVSGSPAEMRRVLNDLETRSTT